MKKECNQKRSKIYGNRAYRMLQILAWSLLLSMCLFGCGGANNAAVPSGPQPMNAKDANTPIIQPQREMRGVWIASVGNINYPTSANTTTAQRQEELEKIVEHCVEMKLNTIFFQVRPAADALYASSYFPVSLFFSETRTLDFDPLAYLIQLCDAYDIDVYAWINPLRITYTGSTFADLPQDHVAKTHPDWVIRYGSMYYFDPGIPQLRTYIASAAAEIAANYDVTGIAFDDYFYPYPVTDENGKTVVFDDSESYATYGENISLADWRRNNINSLIRETYETIKAVNQNCRFGVSPFGIWRNDDGSNGGSATNGLSAYDTLYCDALTWAKDGYVDFLAPQLYWQCDFDRASFSVLADWWDTQLQGTGISLYISHAAYQYLSWNISGEMLRQINDARTKKTYRGSIFYGYDALVNNDCQICDELASLYQDEWLYAGISPLH